MQYWDKENPPREVEELMSSWKEDPSFEYTRYTLATAEAYIRENFDNRVSKAFNECAVPAMQADFFRMCWLLHDGGVYIDADIKNVNDNARLLDVTKRGFLFKRHGNVANDVMAFHRCYDPILQSALEVAIENIKSKKQGDVWSVTGPSIITSFYNDIKIRDYLFDGIDIDSVEYLRERIQFNWDLEYKKTDVHWTNNQLIYHNHSDVA